MKTLVLNAGYEPMSVVSFKRAVVLVLAGKASVLSADAQQPVRSERLELDRPTVIILTRYVKPPETRTVSLSRRGVLRRDAHRCAYCGRSAETVDHVMPRSRGGQNTWTNLVACCRTCNSLKGDRTPEEMGWRLLIDPKPPRTGRFWLREIEDPADGWAPFLALGQAA
ncbi:MULTISPECIES: HNH endonuclease [Brevibacterium]|uniref:HNH endonuclease n=1 Tax=Brevibacterium salitolerans TaxID=1403566 RepID=A0ABN2WJT4_9MICO|nr:HNH endonuclease [Brevibacterium sp.]